MSIPHEARVQPPSTTITPAKFDVMGYLEARDSADPFSIVEFGHGETPIAFQQNPFVGGRTYTGIESWIHNDKARLQRVIAHKLSTDPSLDDQQIAFIDSDSPEAAVMQEDVADEVVFSNVFGDPHFGRRGKNNVQILLTRAAQLLKRRGIIVIRETKTPLSADLARPIFRNLDLDVLEMLQTAPGQEGVWQAAEERYNGDPVRRDPHPMSFYYFLGKQAATV